MHLINLNCLLKGSLTYFLTFILAEFRTINCIYIGMTDVISDFFFILACYSLSDSS